MIKNVSAILLMTVSLGFAAPVQGQVPGVPGVADVRVAYEELDFDLALARADSIIASESGYTPDELVEVHTIAALVHIARNQPSAARPHFVSALSIDPDLELNPASASPQALELFRSVQSDLRTGRALEASSAIRYLRVYDPRPAAAYRSMLVPGWGQLYKGQRTKGYVFLGLWAATAAGTVTAHIVRHDREQAYLDETEPSNVPSRYDEFNRWHRIRNNLAIAAAATWVVSYLDALIFEGPERPTGRPALGVSYRDLPGGSGPSISLLVPLR
ncbi:MAG: hypothetical protein R3178_00730 [Rhodothermales bacterium]|nr:hypothetical protein [Rhodothermales bacterium]